MLPFVQRRDQLQLGGDWWTETFTLNERAAIEAAFKPLGIISAKDIACSPDPSGPGNLVGHLMKEHLRHLGYRLLARADSLVNENVPILRLHFFWAARGEFYYRWRTMDSFALGEAILSFRRQVGMAANALEVFRGGAGWGFVPAHARYRQLRIIEEQRGNLALARALCEKAKAEGWADDWDHQIARIDKKQAKTSS